MSTSIEQGISATQAKKLEYSIIGFCLVSIVFIFQPFSQILFSIGCVGVVIGGLGFNLVPVCVVGTPPRKIIKTTLIVAIIFVAIILIALASAWLYGVYLRNGG